MSALTNAILGYEAGETTAQAAFTTEFWLDVPGATLQDVVNLQETERRTMDTRQGMCVKYLPCKYDAITGHLHVGGYYLFERGVDAAEYDRWTTHEYEVGPRGEKFWARSIFKDVRRW